MQPHTSLLHYVHLNLGILMLPMRDWGNMCIKAKSISPDCL
ncbi:hypothetical protein T02_7264 [Trichinella nativa]|uniref:Uncharacterized protein n=1 Tax=Trichinella nativa TaxID=6335 RepID=A0A0V1KH71_9BILA|nr:hypothetical protein T02_7264 [Trichinella nativa]